MSCCPILGHETNIMLPYVYHPDNDPCISESMVCYLASKRHAPQQGKARQTIPGRRIQHEGMRLSTRVSLGTRLAVWLSRQSTSGFK